MHKSTVTARRPGGEIVLLPFDVEHTAEGLKKLITKLRQLDGEIRIVMEHTGMYWRPIAMTLKEAGFYVSVVNAILIHNFATTLPLTIPDTLRASASDFFMAILLGTNSPKISVK